MRHKHPQKQRQFLQMIVVYRPVRLQLVNYDDEPAMSADKSNIQTNALFQTL
jgi:hypothetical protein